MLAEGILTCIWHSAIGGCMMRPLAKAILPAQKGAVMWDEKTLSVIAATVGLIGTGVPTLTKALESFTLRSRRRQELDRIEDLTSLMKKIKSEEVLSESTLQDVRAQIEAEIRTALTGLDRNRQSRQQVLDKKKERQHSDLTLVSYVLLLFRPHGIQAWIAHFLAYLSALCVIILGSVGISIPFMAADPTTGSRDSAAIFVGPIIFVFFLVLLFRAWALRERSRWQEGHPAAIAVSPERAASRRETASSARDSLQAGQGLVPDAAAATSAAGD